MTPSVHSEPATPSVHSEFTWLTSSSSKELACVSSPIRQWPSVVNFRCTRGSGFAIHKSLTIETFIKCRSTILDQSRAPDPGKCVQLQSFKTNSLMAGNLFFASMSASRIPGTFSRCPGSRKRLLPETRCNISLFLFSFLFFFFSSLFSSFLFCSSKRRKEKKKKDVRSR